jgi:hypothetical protein
LRQVLLNLLDNAVKFTDRGQGACCACATRRRTAALRRRGHRHRHERGAVARLFKPFEQVGDPQHRSGGTGLGLVISRQFVRLMGGDIHVKSRLGVGNLFWFEIDVPANAWTGPVPQAERVVTGYRGPAKTRARRRRRPENRALLVDSAERLGFEVFEAATGHDGLAQSQSLQPDLILMDIVMPDIGGWM